MAFLAGSYDKFCQMHGVVEKGRIEEVGEMISQNVTAYKATPIGKVEGKVEGKIACASIRDVSLVYLDWGAPAVGTSLEREEDFNLRVTLKGRASTSDPNFGEISAEEEHGNARIFSLTEDTNTYSQGHIGLNLVIPHKVLQARARTFYQDELNRPLKFAPLLDLSTVSGQSVLRLIEYFKALHTETPGALESPMICTSFREHMFSSILGGLEHSYRSTLCKGAVDVAIPRTVRKAEEYMRVNADRPITIQLLAKEAGCSERALHNGFRRFRNKSPLSVLRDVRLERAHEDLMRASGSVTDVATKWGFSNLGRFSKSYIKKYGERPSHTLRTEPCQLNSVA